MKKLVKFDKDFGLGRRVCAILLAGWDPHLGALAPRSHSDTQVRLLSADSPAGDAQKDDGPKSETIQAFQRGVCSR